MNETSARKALKAIETDLDLPVSAILTTHAHADHFGGNATVFKRTGAEVWAPPIDEAILRHPKLQPSLLFAGADPPSSMRGGFLLAEPSPVDRIIDEPEIDFDEISIRVVPLPGHSPGQFGFLVDETFFCDDVVLPASVLEKYRVPYLYSATAHLASLDSARSVECRQVIPVHGELADSIEQSVTANRSLIDRVSECVQELGRKPQTAESILTGVLERFDAPIADPGSYFLLHPTIYAFLSHLESVGAVASTIEGKRLLWRTT